MHGAAACVPGGGTVVELRRGLDARSRGEVLRRLHWEGKRGLGPRLPLWRLTVAVALWRASGALKDYTIGVGTMLRPGAYAICSVTGSGLVATVIIWAIASSQPVTATFAAPPEAPGTLVGGGQATPSPGPFSGTLQPSGPASHRPGTVTPRHQAAPPAGVAVPGPGLGATQRQEESAAPIAPGQGRVHHAAAPAACPGQPPGRPCVAAAGWAPSPTPTGAPPNPVPMDSGGSVVAVCVHLDPLGGVCLDV